MTNEEIKSMLMIGEGPTVEFKNCINGFNSDAFETVCSFSNKYGGFILGGVLDDGTVVGVPENAANDIAKNFTNVCLNPSLFSPTLALSPQIVSYEGKTIIIIYVPISGAVHSYKNVIYDRSFDSDAKVTSSIVIGEMYLRKMNAFTEQRTYKYIKVEDLRLDLIAQSRKIAAIRNPLHPWKNLDDKDLLRSAKLLNIDPDTGKECLNLAAIMLLGKDEIIGQICPAYKTDALLRRVNVDRYDDRDIIRTNLIESHDRIVAFGQKHLSDKFHQEGDTRISLRNTILWELASNTLIHREFASIYPSRFIIEKGKMFIENPSRANNENNITPETMIPISKNPIIASFFENIGKADELGSGTRKIFHYTKLYSGTLPTMKEGTLFRTTIPLDDLYSYDVQINKMFEMYLSENSYYITSNQRKILEAMKSDREITAKRLSPIVGISERKIEENIRTLREKGIISRIGNNRSGAWVILKQI